MPEKYLGAFGSKLERRAPCPECKKETRVDTHFQEFRRWEVEDAGISGINEFYVFECRGCETLFFAKSSGNSEEYVEYVDQASGELQHEYIDYKSFWPAVSQTTVPSWAGLNLAMEDETLHDLVRSIYGSMNSGYAVLAAIGMRTAFDRISELLGVDVDISFKEKLEALRKGGHISGVQKGFLEVLVDAGSAAAHRGWKPDENELTVMKDILEALIRDQFILKDKAKALKKKIPSKTNSKHVQQAEPLDIEQVVAVDEEPAK